MFFLFISSAANPVSFDIISWSNVLNIKTLHQSAFSLSQPVSMLLS